MLTNFLDKKEELKRIHIKFEPSLLQLIDEYAKQKKYLNRSEAIREMIRHCLRQDKFIK